MVALVVRRVVYVNGGTKANVSSLMHVRMLINVPIVT
jgi:hypothetical protein